MQVPTFHKSQGLDDQGLVELQPLWRGFQEGQEHQSEQFPWVNWQNLGNTWIWILFFASLASTGKVQKTLFPDEALLFSKKYN